MKITQFLFSVFFLIFFSACNSSPDNNLTEPTNTQTNLTTNTVIELPFHGSESIDNRINISFESLASDSRCPQGAECIWAGDGEIIVKLTSSNNLKSVSLHTLLEPGKVTFENYKIELLELTPYPVLDRQIDSTDYKAKLKISYGYSDDSIVMISAQQRDLVMKDNLSINVIKIENGELSGELSYAGGCENHDIQLYGFMDIMESQPPQMRVQFSHNANNDNCEALISETKKFDLTPLNEFLSVNNIPEIVLNFYLPQSDTLFTKFRYKY